VSTRDRAERLSGQQNGRRGAKGIAKTKQRRRERDRNHDLARRFSRGLGAMPDEDQ